jgi:hypothetical protein
VTADSALTSQTVNVYSGSTRIASLSFAASATSVKVSGLRAGSYYSFRITETNALGSSPESAKSNLVRALR